MTAFPDPYELACMMRDYIEPEASRLGVAGIIITVGVRLDHESGHYVISVEVAPNDRSNPFVPINKFVMHPWARREEFGEFVRTVNNQLKLL
jgi:hypothetical protein